MATGLSVGDRVSLKLQPENEAVVVEVKDDGWVMIRPDVVHYDEDLVTVTARTPAPEDAETYPMNSADLDIVA